MSKFACKCGHVINLSDGTSGSEWTLLPETTIDRIGDMLGDGKMLSDEDFYDSIVQDGVTAYRCPACGRLHLEEAGKNMFVTYVRELC